MKVTVKLLMDFQVPDDPAARKKFREVWAALEPALPKVEAVRDFKMVEDGTGRLLDKWEPPAGNEAS